jgi:hypothetical protein
MEAVGKLGFVVGIVVSIWFLWYGTKVGILERRMLVNRYSGRYVTGPAALRRGMFFVIVGLVGLAIAGMTIARLVAGWP